MDGVMRALARKMTQWQADLFFDIKLTPQKLSRYYAEVILTTRLPLISAYILNLFRKLRSFRMWEKGIDINSLDKTSYTTQSQEAFLKYLENE